MGEEDYIGHPPLSNIGGIYPPSPPSPDLRLWFQSETDEKYFRKYKVGLGEGVFFDGVCGPRSETPTHISFQGSKMADMTFCRKISAN